MRFDGFISKWDDDKGFGFITLTGDRQVFVHISSFGRLAKRPEIGLQVSCEITKDDQGRPNATKVSIVNKQFYQFKKKIRGKSLIIFALFFLSLIGFFVYADVLKPVVLYWYGLLSLLTCSLYWKDKRAAKKSAWRTQEKTLQLFSLFGGWPGALVAQQLLRHKSKKTPFQFALWIIVFVNCIGFVWLFSEQGMAFMEVIDRWVVEMFEVVVTYLK
ncbi:MAG: cold shock and DUF1294 domain-containing protein [Gammaproteobacteria bacterium]|nr:cold shock and DUF1294 domain-containing protein [Gammaproteobacteria bacterium]